MFIYKNTLYEHIPGHSDWAISQNGDIITPFGFILPEVGQNGFLLVNWQIPALPAYKSYLHRLVYTTWIGPVRRGYMIIHKDGNKLNNHIANLIEVHKQTRQPRKQKRKILQFTGSNQARANNLIISFEKANEIKDLYKTKQYTQIKLAEIYQVNVKTINRIINNLRKIDKKDI